MIEGGWNFVYPAYALTVGALGVLAVVVVVRMLTWQKRAAELEKGKPE